MNANSTLFYELLRTTIALSLIAGTAALVLRLTRLRSPALHRAACLLALVAGWTFLRIPSPCRNAWCRNTSWRDRPLRLRRVILTRSPRCRRLTACRLRSPWRAISFRRAGGG